MEPKKPLLSELFTSGGSFTTSDGQVVEFDAGPANEQSPDEIEELRKLRAKSSGAARLSRQLAEAESLNSDVKEGADYAGPSMEEFIAELDKKENSSDKNAG